MLTLLHQAFTSLHTSISGRSLLSFWDQVSGFKQMGVKSEVFHRKFSVLTPLAQTQAVKSMQDQHLDFC